MKTAQVHKSGVADKVNEHDVWFNQLINDVVAHIKTDKDNLASGDASKSTREFYISLKNGDNVSMAANARKSMSNIVVRDIVVSYINLLTEKNIEVLKLALDLSANKVLVWAEIKDNDENAEMALIRVESMINAIYSEKTGIDIDSIIVEKSDNLPVPTHYKSVALN